MVVVSIVCKIISRTWVFTVYAWMHQRCFASFDSSKNIIHVSLGIRFLTFYPKKPILIEPNWFNLNWFSVRFRSYFLKLTFFGLIFFLPKRNWTGPWTTLFGSSYDVLTQKSKTSQSLIYFLKQFKYGITF